MKKKIFALLLALSMALSIAACGGSKDDPNAGKYVGYQVDFLGWTPIEEIYGEGENYVVLEGGGKGDISLDGQPLDLKWSLEGETLTLTIEGEIMTGTLADGVLIFDFMGLGDMCFVREGTTPPELEGETMDEAIGDMVDEAFDEPLEDTGYEDDASYDFGDDYSDDYSDASYAGTGELAEYVACNGAYTLTYPTDIWAPTDMDALTEPAGFGSIQLFVQEDQSQVDETINNLNVLLETASEYELTDATYLDSAAQELVVTDEFGEQSLRVLIEFGEDRGAAGVALYIEVLCWDYLDQNVARSILNSIVIN